MIECVLWILLVFADFADSVNDAVFSTGRIRPIQFGDHHYEHAAYGARHRLWLVRPGLHRSSQWQVLADRIRVPRCASAHWWFDQMGQSWSVQKLGQTERDRERERDILDALKWKQRESADKPIQTSAVSGHPFLRQSDKVGNSRYPLSEIIKYDWQ